MQARWRHYWRISFKSLKYIPVSLLVSIGLFIIEFPFVSQNERGLFLLSCLFHGLVISSCIWLSYLAFWAGVLHWLPTRIDRFKRSNLFHFCAAFIGTVIGLFVARIAWSKIRNEPWSFSGTYLSLVIAVAITLLCVFYHAYRSYREEYYRLEAKSADARFNVFKNQMQPHFLFNSLNSLSELIELDASSAAQMSLNLSELYREILALSRARLSTLKEELSVVEKYFALEKLRYGTKFSHSFEIDPTLDPTQAQLPSLLLQTLAENALKHGIAQSLLPGKVSIAVRRASESRFVCEVQNTGSPLKLPLREGMGLVNSRERLELLYPGRHEFTIAALPDSQGTRVSFFGELVSS